jgi:hypothetical protein
MSDGDFARFDEREDVLASVELLEVCAPLLGSRPTLWKWMIVGAQSAVQGAMVCALVDSTGTSVLEKKSAVEVLDWLQAEDNERGERPREKLDYFDNLLRKCIRQLGLVLTASERKDIERLHEEFRNSFIHFTPKGWSIQTAGLPRIIGVALKVVETLMRKDHVVMHLEDEQLEAFSKSLASVRTNLKLT